MNEINSVVEVLYFISRGEPLYEYAGPDKGYVRVDFYRLALGRLVETLLTKKIWRLKRDSRQMDIEDLV